MNDPDWLPRVIAQAAGEVAAWSPAKREAMQREASMPQLDPLDHLRRTVSHLRAQLRRAEADLEYAKEMARRGK